MKKIGFNFCMIASGLCLVFVISGCIAVQNSPTPRFYLLGAVNEKQVSKTMNIASDVLIGV